MATKKAILTGEQKKVLFPVMAAILLLVGLFYIGSESFQSLSRLERSVSEANRKEKAIVKLQDLLVKEGGLLKAFPTVKEKNDVIKEITGWARREGLEVIKIDPKEETLAGTNFMALALTIDGNGDYLQIMRFLKRVEKSTFFVLASSLQLSGYDLQRSRARFDTGQKQSAAEKGFQVTINSFLRQ